MELSGTFWKPGTQHTGTLRNLPKPAYTSTHRNSPEPSGTCLRNPHQHTPELSNPPEPSGTSGTYTSTHQNSLEPSGTCRRNLDQHAHWNSPEPSGTYTSTHRNFWEPSGICLRNLHQHTPELSGTFRNLPEPSSGTCSCDPHRHTPELIWAEDPISLRCWGKINFFQNIQSKAPGASRHCFDLYELRQLDQFASDHMAVGPTGEKLDCLWKFKRWDQTPKQSLSGLLARSFWLA